MGHPHVTSGNPVGETSITEAPGSYNIVSTNIVLICFILTS